MAHNTDPKIKNEDGETPKTPIIEESKREIDPLSYKTWCMEFKNKNNNNIKKREVLDFIFNAVDGRSNPVDLKNADLYVLVEVYRDLLMVGVLPNYKQLKKYNL